MKEQRNKHRSARESRNWVGSLEFWIRSSVVHDSNVHGVSGHVLKVLGKLQERVKSLAELRIEGRAWQSSRLRAGLAELRIGGRV